MKKEQIFSFFSGAGFLDLGFEHSDFEISFVNEYFNPFLEAYKFSRNNLGIPPPRYGYSNESIEDLIGDKKKELLALVEKAKKNSGSLGFIGGPPCPDFSVGGKNRGAKGENGRLTQTYFQLIDFAKPDWFLFENVKGLWRTKKHRVFYDHLKSNLSKEYFLQDRLTNSIEAATPQDRDRIFLFGIRKDISNFTKLVWETKLSFPQKKAFEFEWVSKSNYLENCKIPKPNNVPIELTVQYWFDTNNVECHPNQIDCFKPRAGLEKFKVIEEGDVSRKSYKRLHRWRYSPTAAYGNNEVHLHPYKSRRISVAEALAIQSMPKNFSLPADISLSNKFKMIGNGVPYLLSKAIAELIREYLSKSRVKKCL